MIVFWLVLCSPVAVAAGCVLWILSAFPHPQLVVLGQVPFSFDDNDFVGSINELESRRAAVTHRD